MWELILTLQIISNSKPAISIIEFRTEDECVERLTLMREQHSDLFKVFNINAICQPEEGD